MSKALPIVLLTMLLVIAGAANAYQFEIGTAKGSWTGNTWSGTFLWNTTSTDWHLWDPGTVFTPTYTTANAFADSKFKFSSPTSGTWTFKFTTDDTSSFSVNNHSTGTTANVQWAIYIESNSPIRGNSVDAANGNLTTDGFFHWYNPAATQCGVEDYSNIFNYVISADGKEVKVYANSAVPEPMSIILGIMGLGSIAGFKKFRK